MVSSVGDVWGASIFLVKRGNDALDCHRNGKVVLRLHVNCVQLRVSCCIPLGKNSDVRRLKTTCNNWKHCHKVYEMRKECRESGIYKCTYVSPAYFISLSIGT